MQDDYTDLTSTIVWVESIADINQLPPGAFSVGVRRIDDFKAEALSLIPSLRAIVHDGSPLLSDSGVLSLTKLPSLEWLDLEWCTDLTDLSIDYLLLAPSLRFVILDFCTGLSSAGLQRLQHERPSLDVSPSTSSS